MDSRAVSIRRHTVADLVVLLLLAGFVVFYCLDAAQSSTDMLNLILVLPLSVIVLALCLVQFALDVAIVRRTATASAEQTADEPPVVDVLPVAGIFAVYVLSLPWLGFDVGTSLFIAAFLLLQGERRYLWLLAYSIGFAFALSELFSRMLPYPMPMLVLGMA